MSASLRGLALLCSALLVQDAWACRVPPANQLMGVDEQIALASDVSLAQVVAATPLEGNVVEYRFVVLQRLAGPERRTFTLRGRAAGTPAFLAGGTANAGERASASFDHHTAPAFWQRGGGRTTNGADCAIRPAFTLGHSYLVFLDSPWTWRSFERIEAVDGAVDEGDRWLAYVKAGLARRAVAPSGR
ncbi:hypothetical protein [Massilia sp.]|uniref:hypothetical protein n=1 Tax=Massilia sp. TaxID=1882437 RepID=UPI0028A874FD|nr:hypothetical protein [Massilia sp.]